MKFMKFIESKNGNIVWNILMIVGLYFVYAWNYQACPGISLLFLLLGAIPVTIQLTGIEILPKKFGLRYFMLVPMYYLLLVLWFVMGALLNVAMLDGRSLMLLSILLAVIVLFNTMKGGK